ncbi:RagB/SusD family nutrient uptake outer membrane protein [Flavobacterium aurantiibacter]|uniref:RagB/SusD family nutrient uptake outer membrane protein n=1 Tax=Flavobacterium aurantiibacter TaxID=2023067 RepID=A0A255ZNH5_9FLAO|nr:RagB/SusD family nutrient uptake outer membrane protein [Flavobacterium aurantiibacter]OYQ42949.1 RagB/SusD family nutrient uptake outer membrane protein [Flavobacterium aurantiibacter]
MNSIYSLKSKFFSALLLSALLLSSCNDDFTNRPPEDSIALESFYATNEQVAKATNAMYNRTWFYFHNKFFFAIAEVGSGNMMSYSPDVNAMRNFSITGSDGELLVGWQSLWANVAQANSIINYLEARVGSGVSPEVLQNTVGEAYFMRATAYFYLVRLWGAVPIIENNVDYVNDPLINTNRVEDVYTLIERDYLTAIEKLYDRVRSGNYAENAKVTKGSAKSMLAKVYLYQKKYAEARAMAEDVISSGEFKLLGGAQLPNKSFADLFTFPNNNNEESIFALQWKNVGVYGNASNCNTQFGISNGTVSTSNASYGGVFGPSQDILSLYTTEDLRRRETIMFPGAVYPNVLAKIGSDFGPLVVPPADQIGGQNAGAAIKKYCIGIVNGNATGSADPWAMMENNTYIMRYAELLLIHAEAILAGGGSTSDASALSSFNAVRTRAGLSPATSITFNDIFVERRKELAFEGDYWFDLGRIPRAQAIAIMSAQNRGDRVTAQSFTPEESDFILPYPTNDVAKNPKLTEPPVPYTFN